MRELVRALYGILACTALLVVGTRASDDSEVNVIYSDNEEAIPSIQNKDTSSPMEHLDDSLDNSVSFVSEYRLVPTRTEEIEYYSCSSSSSTELYDHDADQPMKCTEQTVCESGTEYLLSYYNLNEPVQKHTESESLGNYAQSSKAKRHKKAVKKSTPRKKQKKTEESTASSSSINSTDSDVLDSSKIIRIKRNISIWKNSKLKDRHREGHHESYKPVIAFNNNGNNKYKEIGDKIYQSLIETYIKYCKAAYSEIPIQNEFWFAIASRTSRVHTKHADCTAMNTNPSDYKFIEELSGYYSGLPGDIVRYMDKNGPMISKQKSIKTEWNEAIGDIYVRKTAEPEYGIDKEIITSETCNEHRLVATAVQMILALPEVHKDLFNLSVEFVEKAFRANAYSNHFAIVRALHKIVEQHKSSNKSNIDQQYTVIYNAFRDMLQKTCVSPDSIVIKLYTEMYKSISYFYKKAEVCEEILGSKKKKKNGEKEYYLFAGKCIIKQQRYLKCTTTIDLNKKDIYEYTHQITEETNKWSIPSDIHNHYHIHYVDNTKQKYTRICMPMYSDQHIHTISQTIKYLKRLYNIEKEECICPYIRNKSGYWECISKKERDKTLNEFAECDIVFYYIEEEIRDSYFTFAEFESYAQPKGRVVRIPLFLSPLMRSTVSMGPFEERDKKKHTLVDSMQSLGMQPNVYTYKEKYKAIDYSHVHHYCSNLYIRRDNADIPTIDCYIMDSKATIDNETATVEWYAKIPNSVDEYTHCILSDELLNDQERYDKFSKVVKKREYTPDSALYGFGLQSSAVKIGGLDGVDDSTSDPKDPNNIFDCKLSIISIHKIYTNPEIIDIQSKIDELNKEHNRINMKIKEPGIAEEQKNELKRKRKTVKWKKYYTRQKLKNKQPKDHLLIEEEFCATPLPLCFFLVFRRSNTRTKSGLGAHNEILDALAYRYNCCMPKHSIHNN